MIWHHSSFREPPPTTRSSSTLQPNSCSLFIPARRANAVPSSAALYTTPGLARPPGLSPRRAPLACGQLGVRSPLRYGRKLTPPQPAGTPAASRVASSWLSPDARRASSATAVQFMMQSSGSHAPVQSQKGATVPVGSRMGLGEYPKRVAEVPRETTQTPSLTAPAPSALIMLSPPPGATSTPSGSPVAAAAAGSTAPIFSPGPTSGGSHLWRLGSMRAAASVSHRRLSTSSSAVPLASPHSAAAFPVRYRLT
mmetsp:Transcript_37448/g.89018  ORF Transcript_37448/g.89018 Transcript_37448/m.89018 type:complete len:253 (-) Transcript_37448:508-1266(-)